MKYIAGLLLIFFAFVSCSSAADLLPAKEYIDAGNVDESFSMQRNFFREFVEEHGGENPDETFRRIKDLLEDIRDIKAKREVEDRFRINSRFDRMQIYLLSTYLEPLVRVIAGPKETHASADLDILFDTIKEFFGDDLNGFASGRVNHDIKLHAFLYKTSKEILSNELEGAFNKINERHMAEMFMSRVVLSYVEEGRYTPDDISALAQKMNLAKDSFDGEKMLQYLEELKDYDENYSDLAQKNNPVDYRERLRRYNEHYIAVSSHKKRLYLRLEDICKAFHLVYNRGVEIFIWSRLLIPEEITQPLPNTRMLSLVEYERVCLPVRNPKTFKKVIANIKRNTGMTRRIKDGLKSMIN